MSEFPPAPAARPAGPPRAALIDALKLLCAQVIVLHHFSLYGPIGENAAAAWPALMAAIEQHGRLAVQVFLVIGGFLAARSLSGRPRPLGQALSHRYMRLVPLLAVSLGLVLAATAALPEGSMPDWVTPWPSLPGLIAHLLLLQDILGVPALSAGVWYLSIDFQLFALLAITVALARQSGREVHEGAAPWVVAALALASLWHFNRQPALDAWAPYFLSSYGLGALAAWAGAGRQSRTLFVLVAALHLLDGLLDPRPRLFLALATALVLWLAADRDWAPGQGRRLLAWGSDSAYALFVSHYAVILALTALWMHLSLDGPAQGATLVALGWGLSLALGAALHRWAEPRWTGRSLGKPPKAGRAKT